MCIYIHTHTHTHVYIYIYIYIIFMATSQDNHTSNSHFTGEETETQRDLVICPESFSCKRWSWHLNPVSLAKASMLLTAIIVTTKLISRVLQNLREKATDMVRLLLALSCPRAAFLQIGRASCRERV